MYSNCFKIKSNNLIVIIALFIFMLWIIWAVWNSKNATGNIVESIKKNPIITSGNIVRIEHGYKRINKVVYTFTYNNKIFKGKSSSSSSSDKYYYLNSNLIGMKFPVILNKENPNLYNKILILKDDFKIFGLKYPDSLEKYNLPK